MSEGSQVRVKEMPAGERAMEECDPLGLLTCVVAIHMSDKRYGETYNMTTAIRNYYSNSMLHNKDLATYYSRCRALLFVKAEAYRLADEEPLEYTDEFHATIFITALNATYSEYINNFKSKVREWPLTIGDAYADAANYLMARPGPAGDKHRNVFAAHRGGRGGRAGRGRGRGERDGQENSGCKSTEGRAATPHRERENSDRSGTLQEYGTRYGRCNSCGHEGYWAKKCHEEGRAGKKSATAWNPSHQDK